MEHNEQRVWMIKELLSEEEDYRGYQVPKEEQDQKNLLRALMNVRPPRRISKAFLDIQDQYLTEENRNAGITDVESLSPCPSDNRLFIWQGDITTIKIDAIVNAANSGMTGCYRALHNCIDNCIHSRAGIQLRLKCNDIIQQQGHEEPTGQAKITPAYNLPCKYVLHTVGPIVDGRLTQRHCDLLASCYRSCLELAEENNLHSIAFCCISTGVFMFPKDKAAEIAVPPYEEIKNGINQLSLRANLAINKTLDENKSKLDNIVSKQLFKAPCELYAPKEMMLDNVVRRLQHSSESLIMRNKNKLDLLKNSNVLKNPENIIKNQKENYLLQLSKLEILNPLNTLKRGYTLAKIEGKVVSSAKQLKSGDDLEVEFEDGNVNTKVI